MGRMAEAEAALARGRGRPPSWSDPWHDELDRYRYGHLAELDRAKARFQAGDVRGAVELLERVKRTGTVTAQVHENLALCYLAMGQRRRAVAELRQGLELSPDGMQSNYLLAGAYHLEMDKAPAASRDELHRLVLHHVDRALKAAPTYAPAHGLKAEMLAIDGDLPGAIEAYREAARWDPENADWLFEAARLHGRLRQWPQAVECLEQVTRLRPDHAEAHGRLGVAYMAMDRLDEAEQALLTARRLDPALDQRIRAALEQVRARRLTR
jgi:tetratricopeptide (TPR) repeat protein